MSFYSYGIPFVSTKPYLSGSVPYWILYMGLLIHKVLIAISTSNRTISTSHQRWDKQGSHHWWALKELVHNKARQSDHVDVYVHRFAKGGSDLDAGQSADWLESHGTCQGLPHHNRRRQYEFKDERGDAGWLRRLFRSHSQSSWTSSVQYTALCERVSFDKQLKAGFEFNLFFQLLSGS